MSGGFLARAVFVQGVFVRGFMSGGFCPGGFCPRTTALKPSLTQDEIFLARIFDVFWFHEVSVGFKRKGDACMQVCVVVSSSFSILEIHRMTGVAQF